MLKATELLFDDDLELSFHFSKTGKNVRLNVDTLETDETTLQLTYNEMIAKFINQQENWYDQVIASIISEQQDEFGMGMKSADFELLVIYVLPEEANSLIFGLQFHSVHDEEHGVGVKLVGDSFEVLSIGSAEEAFC
ncbi:hypothetical protein IGI37_001256 [Enterococcus sp. AZ194]|uniref:hypothetical protein n=1 Tax=Enterococcus sp. AZ194 TaxID=2774629 RepID=UPI003F27C750